MAKTKITLNLETDDYSSRYLKELEPLETQHIHFSFDRLSRSQFGTQNTRDQLSKDSRDSLYFLELKLLFLSIFVPTTVYVLKKLADPVLEDLGKALSKVLKDWVQSLKRDNHTKSREYFFIVDFGDVKYLVSMNDARLADKASDVIFILKLAIEHFRNSPEAKLYQIQMKEKQYEIVQFDPFPQ